MTVLVLEWLGRKIVTKPTTFYFFNYYQPSAASQPFISLLFLCSFNAQIGRNGHLNATAKQCYPCPGVLRSKDSNLKA